MTRVWLHDWKFVALPLSLFTCLFKLLHRHSLLQGIDLSALHFGLHIIIKLHAFLGLRFKRHVIVLNVYRLKLTLMHVEVARRLTVLVFQIGIKVVLVYLARVLLYGVHLVLWQFFLKVEVEKTHGPRLFACQIVNDIVWIVEVVIEETWMHHGFRNTFVHEQLIQEGEPVLGCLSSFCRR